MELAGCLALVVAPLARFWNRTSSMIIDRLPRRFTDQVLAS